MENCQYSITKFISLQITARMSTHLHPCHWGWSLGPRHHNDYDAPSRLIRFHSARLLVHDLPDQVQRNGESLQSQAFRSNGSCVSLQSQFNWSCFISKTGFLTLRTACQLDQERWYGWRDLHPPPEEVVWQVSAASPGDRWCVLERHRYEEEWWHAGRYVCCLSLSRHEHLPWSSPGTCRTIRTKIIN